MFTTEEIDSWDKLIEESGDLALARNFYPKAGRSERVKEVFRNAVRNLADYDLLLQEKFEQRVYRPELTDEEVKQIAAEVARQNFENGYLGELFRKLDLPVYAQTRFSDEELGNLVNKVLREGVQGYHPGENPRKFAGGLIEFPDRHEFPEEVSFTYAVFDDEKYQKFAEPQLAKNVITLKVFHRLLLGRFGEASEVINKYNQHYDHDLTQQFVQNLVTHKAFSEENYSLEYLVAAYRSSLRELFPQDIAKRIEQRAKEFDDFVEEHKTEISQDVDIQQSKEDFLAGYRRLALASDIADYLDGRRDVTPTAEIDKIVSVFGNDSTKQQYAQRRGLQYEKTTAQLDADKLHKAFDETEDDFEIFLGMKELEELLSNEAYVEAVGKERIRAILNERTARAMQNGKAHAIYALRFGINMDSSYKYPAVPHFDEYVTVDKSNLLESMVSAVHWDPEFLLSDKYDFSCDNLTIAGTSEVDDAYALYQSIRQEDGKLPQTEAVRKLIFLKMAVHAKEYYEGKGMKTVVDVFENPSNAEYIDPDQTKKLLTKIFDENFYDGIRRTRRGTGIGGRDHLTPDYVSYLYTLASSKLGALIKDDPRVSPYFKLYQFLDLNEVVSVS